MCHSHVVTTFSVRTFIRASARSHRKSWGCHFFFFFLSQQSQLRLNIWKKIWSNEKRVTAAKQNMSTQIFFFFIIWKCELFLFLRNWTFQIRFVSLKHLSVADETSQKNLLFVRCYQVPLCMIGEERFGDWRPAQGDLLWALLYNLVALWVINSRCPRIAPI